MEGTSRQRPALRIGVVQGGRIVEERLLWRPAEVQVGSDARCAIVLPPGRGVPRACALFVVDKGRFAVDVERVSDALEAEVPVAASGVLVSGPSSLRGPLLAGLRAAGVRAIEDLRDSAGPGEDAGSSPVEMRPRTPGALEIAARARHARHSRRRPCPEAIAGRAQSRAICRRCREHRQREGTRCGCGGHLRHRESLRRARAVVAAGGAGARSLAL
jgi:hypothetical protein